MERTKVQMWQLVEKTLLDGISSWQAMQMLWWEEIDCNSGKRGYKCGNSDAGIRLPGVN